METKSWVDSHLQSMLQPGSFWPYVKSELQEVTMETGRTIRTLLHLLSSVVWVSGGGGQILDISES